jgi:hypothetical protein
LRPLFVFCALIALILLDLLALNLQDAALTLEVSVPAAVIAARAPSPEDEHLAWLEEIGASGLSLRVAQASAGFGAGPRTRAEILRTLLPPENGG